MKIAIPIFPGVTALDAVGPYEVLSRLPDAEVQLIAAATGPIRTHTGMLALLADAGLEELSEPDVIIVPGGHITPDLTNDEQLLTWLRHAHEHSQWTTSVCTGALLLAAAGILNGLQATTHWLALDKLTSYGAHPVRERVVEQGKIITSAGVSAGIDMALTLAARIADEQTAQAIQLSIEYDPQPPFNAGSTHSAPNHIVQLVRSTAARVG